MSIDRRTVIQGSVGAALAGAIVGRSAEALAEGGAAQQGIPLQAGVRRVITGNDAQGKSYFVSDERVAPGTAGFPNLFQTTGDSKVGPGRDGDSLELLPTDMPQIEPAPGGSSFHYQTLCRRGPPTTSPCGTPRRPWTTTSCSAASWLLMVDAGEVTLHPGDVVIQRNTAHAWRNPSNAPVHWVAVLVPLK